MGKLEFERINLEYLFAVVFLGITLILSVIYGLETTVGNIGTGLVGYIGGRSIGYLKGRQFSEEQKKGAINNG